MIRGVFFDGERSRGVAAEIGIDAARRVRLVLVDARGGEVGAEEAASPREWTRPLAELEISARIANIPRRIVFPDVGTFETTDNDGVDRALAAHGQGPGLVHWLETRWPIAIASLLAVALGSFLFVRFGLPALADLAARTLPTSVDRVIGSRTLELLDQAVLEPSKLPEARQRELEERFAAMARPLEDGHDDLLRPLRLQGRSDVEGERIVAAAMRADRAAVHKDFGLPIDGAEMEQQLLVFPISRHFERAAIPEPVLLANELLHAGERRLDRKRHHDRPRQRLPRRRCITFMRRGPLPHAVEVHPGLSHHLRTRIFAVHVLGSDHASPACRLRTRRSNGGGRRLPLQGHCGAEGDGDERRRNEDVRDDAPDAPHSSSAVM